MKINWLKKITSRKFWTSIASFVAMLMIYFGAAESEAAQITSLIMAGATVIGYLVAEGLADAGNAGNSTEDTTDQSDS